MDKAMIKPFTDLQESFPTVFLSWSSHEIDEEKFFIKNLWCNSKKHETSS